LRGYRFKQRSELVDEVSFRAAGQPPVKDPPADLPRCVATLGLRVDPAQQTRMATSESLE
jgi:hypothetical protein